MKKLTIILTVLIVITIRTNAQIPNNGFENWITVGSYEDPTDWATMNPACAGPFYSCTKSTDHYPASVGNYSIRLENNTSLIQATGAYGMAITDTFAYPFQPAFPIVGNPTSLCGYYQYNSVNNDSMFIRIVFFENSIMLGYNTFVTGITTSNWTSFTLPLSYPSPDSATLYFSAFYPSGQTSGPKGNSVLYVDNLSFDNLITSELLSSGKLPGKFSLAQNYPNPFNPTTKINYAIKDAGMVTLKVYDILGNEVAILVNKEQAPGIYEVEFNAEQTSYNKQLSSGIYFYRLHAGSFAEVKKLVLLK